MAVLGGILVVVFLGFLLYFKSRVLSRSLLAGTPR
jgi:hypothetical protein